MPCIYEQPRGDGANPAIVDSVGFDPVPGGDGENDFIFLLNFKSKRQALVLGKGSYTDMLAGKTVSEKIVLEANGSAVLKRKC